MRASIALIDFRGLSLSRPTRYRRNAPRCATWPKHVSNGSNHRANRSIHAGAVRGSTASQRTELSTEEQGRPRQIAPIRSRISGSDTVVLGATLRYPNGRLAGLRPASQHPIIGPPNVEEARSWLEGDVITVLAGLAAIWRVLTLDTVPDFLAKRGVTLSVAALSLFILVMLALLIALVRTATPHPQPLAVRRVRRLEYHIAHMVWIRASVLDPGATEPELKDHRRVVQKHRDLLLDLDTELFPPSTKERFRRPALLNVATARAMVQNMSHSEARATTLAEVDQLLNALQLQWVAESGRTAPAPS